jgi:hypothetical protein
MADTERCRLCGAKGVTLVYRTYPAYVLGQRIEVDFVAVVQCPRCGHVGLTPEGRKRIEHFVANGQQPDSTTRH